MRPKFGGWNQNSETEQGGNCELKYLAENISESQIFSENISESQSYLWHSQYKSLFKIYNIGSRPV